MTKDQEKFYEWLGENMLSEGNKTRLEFVKQNGLDVLNLLWAFSAGYNKGLLKGLEEGSK